jgi:hypothetical protein
MNYLIHKNGVVLGLRIAQPKASENLQSISLTEENQALYESLVKPKVANGALIEGASQEEIAAFEKLKVKSQILASEFFIKLKLDGITQSDLISQINALPNSILPQIQKDLAVIKIDKANYFERYDADMVMIGQLLGFTEDKIDSYFI